MLGRKTSLSRSCTSSLLFPFLVADLAADDEELFLQSPPPPPKPLAAAETATERQRGGGAAALGMGRRSIDVDDGGGGINVVFAVGRAPKGQAITIGKVKRLRWRAIR